MSEIAAASNVTTRITHENTYEVAHNQAMAYYGNIEYGPTGTQAPIQPRAVTATPQQIADVKRRVYRHIKTVEHAEPFISYFNRVIVGDVVNENVIVQNNPSDRKDQSTRDVRLPTEIVYRGIYKGTAVHNEATTFGGDVRYNQGVPRNQSQPPEVLKSLEQMLLDQVKEFITTEDDAAEMREELLKIQGSAALVGFRLSDCSVDNQSQSDQIIVQSTSSVLLRETASRRMVGAVH